MTHTPGAEPRAKMDTPTGLFGGVCSCGWRSTGLRGSEAKARGDAQQHVDARNAAETAQEPPVHYVIRLLDLVGTSGGDPRAQAVAGQYVKRYDPADAADPLEVTGDPWEAQTWPSQEAALLAWRKQHGLRPDGRPNRPLTAYTVEVIAREDAHGWGPVDEPHPLLGNYRAPR
jgi:hypothetical protein